MAIFIHLINLIKFNRFSKSNVVTGSTGLTITDVEPVDKVPRYSWLVREHFSRRTAVRILPKLGMNVPYYKNKKVTRPFVRENSGSLIMRKNVFF